MGKENYKLYNGDCLEVFKNIKDKSVNLILIDPPYNIGKDKKWDKWKTVDAYVEFMGKVFLECQRVLKDNGSFYFFHNDFLQIVELQNYINNNTDFVFKQLLVWNKRFNKASNKGFLDGFIEVEKLRNYQKMAEYCLYYTFQDETGLNKILKQDGFLKLMNYFREERLKLGWNYKQCDDYLGIKASYCYWDKPTTHPYRIPDENHYLKLQKTGYFKRTYEDLRQEYEDLRQEYEDLRQEYEDLRYTFNNQKTHHDVLDFEVAKKQGHITPKPVDLLEYIIKTSSNEGDIILDCFMGSGSTGVACMNSNRKFIGIELDNNYFNIAKQRIEEACK